MGGNMKTWAMLVVVLLAVLGIIGGIFFFAQQTFVKKEEGPAMGLPPSEQGIDWTKVCGDDKKGTIYFSLRNPLNSTGSEYEGTTVRFYQLSDGEEKFIKTVSGSATGYASTTLPCGKDYVAYCESSSSVASLREEFTVDEEEESFDWLQPEVAGLIFKVYNDEARAYVYPSAASTAATWTASGGTFYSTTSNSTGMSVGADGYVMYSIEFETNGTAATDKQFQDLTLLIAIDSGNGSVWQEPSKAEFTGGTTTKVDCPTKIASDLYDWCYEVTVDGEAPAIEDSINYFKLEQHTVQGVDPLAADTIKIGIFTSGRYKTTFGSEMKEGYNKDDSSQTYVRTGQTATLTFA